jgi:hypothetical protein
MDMRLQANLPPHGWNGERFEYFRFLWHSSWANDSLPCDFYIRARLLLRRTKKGNNASSRTSSSKPSSNRDVQKVRQAGRVSLMMK